ncbi:MAG TPA: CPBP family glutamic-type intramembrane protease [Cyclobacteriaceae bacterium]|nr:CPBP family glutamic-type intramembrane protease [Cyclobacteriaceae bacterium]
MKTTETSEEIRACPYCDGTVRPTDTFCGHCGKELKNDFDGTREDVISQLTPALLYYGMTLILLATFKFTSVFPSGLEGMIGVTIIDVLIVIAFWARNIREINPLFSFAGFDLRVAGLTVLFAIVGSVVVSVVANWINLSIQDDVFYDTYLFQDTRNPFLFSVIFIAVQPAIFEEVAFRGFLFNNVARLSNGESAIFITGFIFGLIHLQFISLFWLVPIGLAFAFLRNKYNTLWYGVIGHFTYNFCITLFEFKGWF